jgi:heme A synthase
VILGSYLRHFRDEHHVPNWRPSSWIFPKDESQWQNEYKVYEQPKNINDWRLRPSQFKDLYDLDWRHRTYAMGLGAYVGLPLLGLWRHLAPGVKGCVLGAAGLGGLMVAVDWLQVYHGLVSTPVCKAIRHTFCYAQYSLLLWGGLTQFRPDNADFIKTVARLQVAMEQRSLYLLALSFLAGALATGGLEVSKGKEDKYFSWPWYDDGWFFPALSLKPLYRNFTENKEMFEFYHRTCSSFTALTVFALWEASRLAPLGATAARCSLYAVFLSILSGAVTLKSLSRFGHMFDPSKNSLRHEKLSLVLLTILLVGLHGVRKPINISSLI